MTAEQRAARKGALWLDKHAEPRWADKVSLPELNMCSPSLCVLGQYGGEYSEQLNAFASAIGIPAEDDDGDDAQLRWAVTHGFTAQRDSRGEDKNGSFERLAFAWAPLIATRQLRSLKRRIKGKA